MKFVLRLLIVVSGISFVAVCNDTATFAEMLFTTIISGSVIIMSLIALLLLHKERFALAFENDKGQSHRVRAKNIVAKWLTLVNFKLMGYELTEEQIYWED